MMKKCLCVFLAAAMLTAFTATALAEEDDRLIRVGGNATVTLAADTATIQIGVNTRSESIREAQKENAELMTAVMDAILGMGIAEKDIVTSQFIVYSGYEYESSMLGKESRKLYYEVQNNVKVTLHDLSQIGAVLDAAMEAGANSTYGISFSSTQANEAYQKALTRAVEDAVRKAQVLAAAAGVKLGKLVSINAAQNNTVYGGEVYGVMNSFAYEAKTADASTSISSGDVSVSAEVVLEYAFD